MGPRKRCDVGSMACHRCGRRTEARHARHCTREAWPSRGCGTRVGRPEGGRAAAALPGTARRAERGGRRPRAAAPPGAARRRSGDSGRASHRVPAVDGRAR
eukprot:6661030-Prymnesium_polylepis.1